MTKPNLNANRFGVTRRNFLRAIGAIALLCFLLLPISGVAAKSGNQSYIVYIGTYTHTESKGIYAYRFTPSTGEIVSLGLAAETAHPSYLLVHPNHRFLYAVNEHESKTEPGNTVSAFALDTKTGKLRFLNRVSSKGIGPCHIAIDKTGKFLAVGNFGSGSVATLPIHSDGSLGEASAFIQHVGKSVDPVAQAGPHAHCVAFSLDNRFLVVADRGLDKIMVYRFNHSTGALEPNDPAFVATRPGEGPRHLAFNPNGKYLYVITELKSNLITFDYDAAHGTLKEVQMISALPAGFSGRSSSAEIQVDRAGKFVYGSNRGDDSIGVFAIDPGNGTLTPVEFDSTQGKTPRNFSIDPTGGYLIAANQNSATVVVYRRDQSTGKLTPTGQVLKEATEPSCVTFVASK